MKKIIELVESYLHDSTYYEFLEYMKPIVEDHRYIEEYLMLKTELETILSTNNLEETENTIASETMGIGAWPDDIDPNGEDSYRRLFERIYIDLFKEDTAFKPELLKLEKFNHILQDNNIHETKP